TEPPQYAQVPSSVRFCSRMRPSASSAITLAPHCSSGRLPTVRRRSMIDPLICSGLPVSGQPLPEQSVHLGGKLHADSGFLEGEDTHFTLVLQDDVESSGAVASPALVIGLLEVHDIAEAAESDLVAACLPINCIRVLVQDHGMKIAQEESSRIQED